MPTFKKHYKNFDDNVAFDSSKIIKYLKKLPNKYSSGPDGIPSTLLHKLSKELSLFLSILFQKSYQQSKLLSEWKYANVIPVFKGKGNRHTVENYRPISLTCTQYVKLWNQFYMI